MLAAVADSPDVAAVLIFMLLLNLSLDYSFKLWNITILFNILKNCYNYSYGKYRITIGEIGGSGRVLSDKEKESKCVG